MPRAKTNTGERDYWLNSKADIARTLALLKRNSCLLSADVGHGKSSFITTIVDIDLKNNLVFLDYAPKDYISRQVLEEGNVVFTAVVSGIRMEFSAVQVSKGILDGDSVFAFPIPDKLLWVQRRQFYRVKTPMERRPRCRITIGEDTSDLAILDISISGLALLAEDPALDSLISAGLLLDACTVVLPDFGTGTVTLEVRNKGFHSHHTSGEYLRIGCAFRDIAPAFESAIQRYMQMVERRSKHVPPS